MRNTTIAAPRSKSESAKRGQTPKGEESRRDRRERPVAVAVSNTIAENTVLRAFRGDFRTGVRGDSTT